MYLIRFDHLPL
ncbi:unnamed protein product, partial [Rotaria sordida]